MATVQHPDNLTQPQSVGGVGLAASAVFALMGTVGLVMLSVWTPLLDREHGQYLLKASDDGRVLTMVPDWLVGAALVASLLGALGALAALWTDRRVYTALGWCRRWMAAHPWFGALIVMVMACGSLDMYELLYNPFDRRWGLQIWMLREDVQLWLSLAAAVLGGLVISAAWRKSEQWGWFTQWLCNSLQRREVWWWFLAAAAPLTLGAAMCAVALDGIPHFSDSLTYLMQGRLLYDGRLWMPTPNHPQLFEHTLFFHEAQGRFYGKYPIGWPVIVGAFDRLGVGYAANATMAGLAAVLTGLVAREFASRRVAVLAAVLFGLSPWIWFNGANFASHVSTTCAVLAFVWMFLRTLRTSRRSAAVGTGVALAAAVLIRPFDAAMFALPVMMVVLWLQTRRPQQWIALGTFMALGPLAGVGLYLWVNTQTTGAALVSAYTQNEAQWDTFQQFNVSQVISRVAFQWAELNGRYPGWGIGGLTVAAMGGIAAGQRWQTSGLRLLTAGAVLYFFGCAAFGFTNVWWGPRWLVPVTPLLAILAAELADRMITQLLPPLTGQIKDHGATAAAQLATGVLLSGLLVGLGGCYVGQFYQHRLAPPHMVSAAVHQAVLDKADAPAVVAMAPLGHRAPLDARAGFAFMHVPFEANAVIYVRAVPNWQKLAAQSYPDRSLYQVRPEPKDTRGFTIDLLHLQ